MPSPADAIGSLALNLIANEIALLAAKVLSVLGVTIAHILRVFGISAERAAAAGKCFSGCDDGVGSSSFLDPIDHRAQHIELVKRGAAAAVSHTRD